MLELIVKKCKDLILQDLIIKKSNPSLEMNAATLMEGEELIEIDLRVKSAPSR